MTVTLKSHADFRRFLADPRARITILEDTALADAPGEVRDGAVARGHFMTRRVKVLQTNGVGFENPLDPTKGPSWLYWDSGTRDWAFEGDSVTVPNRARPGQTIRYRCDLTA